MNHNEIIAREGWVFIFAFILMAIPLYYFTGYAGASPAIVLALFCIYFFRNPRRIIPNTTGTIVAPADGRIMDIEKVNEEQYLHTPAIRVRIFLSLFNVHINRCPINGQVEFVQTVPGQYLAAYKTEAGTVNARNYVGLNTNWGKILVVQITGLVARRLVCWINPGDNLVTGERFGLIRFGSCTELYLPVDANIKVQAGDKVKGGVTVIAGLSE